MAPLKFKILPSTLQNILKCPPVYLIQILRSFEKGFKNRSAMLVCAGAMRVCFDSFIGCHVFHVRRAVLRHHQVNLVENELLSIKNRQESTVYRTF
jgi:hypothetical protein